MARTNTANFAQTPIVAPNISQTILTGEVTESALFPANNFYAVIEQVVDNVPVEEEVVFCTSRTGTAFTVTRAQDGTTAKAFTGNVRLSLNVVSAHLQELRDGIDGVSVVPATAKTPPIDADVLTLWNSASSFAKEKVTWANIKATLKTYFDTLYVALTGNQTIAGIKTFSSFPVTPSSAPTTDYQTANKKYVDDKVSPVGYSFLCPLISGSYYHPSENYSPGVTATVTNRLLLFPIKPSQNVTIQSMHLDTTAGAGNIKFLVYSDVAGVPTTLLLDSGSIAVTSAISRTISHTFTAGVTYWVGVWTSSNPTLRTNGAEQCVQIGTALSGTPVYTFVASTTAFGVTPDPAPAMTDTNGNVPAVLFRIV